jgi:hypothetical protein
MKIARRPRLTAMLLAELGLVFEGAEGQWTFQAGSTGFEGECGTGASRRLGDASAIDEHSWIGASDEVVSKHGGVDAALFRRV